MQLTARQIRPETDLLGHTIWTKQVVQERVLTDTRFARRMVDLLYKRQEKSERVAKTAFIRNNRGFSLYDAFVLTSAAEALRNRRRVKWSRITPMLPKYWKQVLDELDARGEYISKRH